MSAPIVRVFEDAWRRMPPALGLPDAVYAHPATVHELRRELDLLLAFKDGEPIVNGTPLIVDRWAPGGDFFPTWDRHMPEYQRNMMRAARGARIETASIASVLRALERVHLTVPDRDRRLEHSVYLLEMFARGAVRVKP